MRRLSPALLTMLMLGVIGLLVALYFGKKLFATAEPAPVEDIINIPMALTDLEPGTMITEAHVGLGRALSSKITRDVVRSNRILVGRVVKNAITAAEPISTYDLYPQGKGPDPAIAPGMRAVSIPLGDDTSLNVIQPGHFVDVHFTPAVVTRDGGLTMTLFKGVKVQSINGNAISSVAGRGGNNVTLELTQEQANIILLAKDRGALNLVYNPDGKDFGVVTLENADRATLNEILGIEEEAPEEPEQLDPPFVTEVFSGAGRRTQQFREGRRSDLYAIENFDYYRNNNRSDDTNSGWQGYGRGVPAPDFELQGAPGGSNSSFYSVPAGGGNSSAAGEN